MIRECTTCGFSWEEASFYHDEVICRACKAREQMKTWNKNYYEKKKASQRGPCNSHGENKWP